MSLILKQARSDALADLGGGEHRICEGCGTPFVATQGFERLCPVCFKLDRGYDLYAGDKALLQLQEEYRKTNKELETLRTEHLALRTKAAKAVRVLKSKLSQAEADLRQGTRGLDRQRVEQLIRLCHPDKHGNSKLATAVTRWLLTQRQRVQR